MTDVKRLLEFGFCFNPDHIARLPDYEAAVDALDRVLRAVQATEAVDEMPHIPLNVETALISAREALRRLDYEAAVDALAAYVRAQGRMLDRWAEGDDAVKRELWQSLHACEEPARDALRRLRGDS